MMLIPLKNELKWCILVCLELLTDPVTQLLSATEVQLTEQREQNQTRLSYAES